MLAGFVARMEPGRLPKVYVGRRAKGKPNERRKRLGASSFGGDTKKKAVGINHAGWTAAAPTRANGEVSFIVEPRNGVVRHP